MLFTSVIQWKCSYPFRKYDCGLLRLFLPFQGKNSVWINIVVKQDSFVLTGAHLFYSYKAVNGWALL